MERKFLRLFIALVVLPLFWSCDNSPDIKDLVKNMVVRTTFADNIDFSAYQTFSMTIDTIGLVSNATDDTVVTGNYAKQVSQRVRNNLSSKGYTVVSRAGNPDLLVKAFIVDNQGVYQTYSYGGFGYPGSFYSGYWGYGYGGFYGYPTVQSFSYQSGMLIIQMLDLKNPTQNNEYQVVWQVQIGDVYTSEDPYLKVLQGIDQAFQQSSYLGR